LLIGISFCNEALEYSALFKASETAVREVDPGEGDMGADCIGNGLILGNNLIERFYSPFSGLDELLLIAARIIFHAKRWVVGCGGETDLVIISKQVFRMIHRSDISELEKYFRVFDDWLDPIVQPFTNVNISDEDFLRDLRWREEQVMKFRQQLFSSNLRVFEILKEIKRDIKPFCP
jgi:hypothetical protein